MTGTYLERLRQIRPRAGFLKSGKVEIFLLLRIAAQDSRPIRPTLAGLLMFGKYPQEFFPQLMITFVQYFGTTEDEKTPQGARFVDNRRFEGPVTEMVDEAETYIMSAMRKSSLMTTQAISWLNKFSRLQLNDHQRLALVYLRQHPYTDNRDYRRLNRVDVITAGQDLRGLVQSDLIEQSGFGRWTKYVLKVKDVSIDNLVHKSDEEKILSYVIKHGSINNSECRKLLNVNDDRAYYLLKKLSEKGKLKTLKKGKGRRYVVP